MVKEGKAGAGKVDGMGEGAAGEGDDKYDPEDRALPLKDEK